MEKVQYKVFVKTGDKPYSGTDANIFIILHGKNGKKSDTVQLDTFFHNDFEQGQVDEFTIQSDNLDEVCMIELWRDEAGIGSNWYVETVKVVNQKTDEEFIFPILRWIKANYHYKIVHLDTSLPGDDPSNEQREQELLEKRKVYIFKDGLHHLPPQVKSLPDDEAFSFNYKWDILKLKAELIINSKISMLTSGNWKSLRDLRNVYTKEIFYEPSCTKTWRDDLNFGYQRIASMNHSLIELCTKLPEKLGVTDEMLRPLLEGCTLQQVIDSKRLFICDLKILDGITHKEGLHVCVPIALFLVNGNHELVPIAIQLYQQKGPNNPVFLPTDPEYTWMLAKMWFNNADASYHQSLSHLGFTHLLMEGIALISHRNLSQSHPIFKLLAPHFLYLIAINVRALEFLVAPNGWIDKTMNAGSNGLLEIVAKGIKQWRMDVHGTLPEDLKRRGVYNQNVLPGYHFRDDALLLYDAIHKYASKYTRLYYDTPEKISADLELQSWREEMTKPREQGGCGLQGVPGENGKFTTVDHIIQTLTCIIYTCSVGHAATNFPQYDQYAFPPNYPGLMKGKPPSSKKPLTEQDVINSLPDKPTTLDTMIVTKILSTRGTNQLGNFEVQYIFDPKAMKVVEEFQKELAEISVTIKGRNNQRKIPYPFLDPEFVPNSISI
ncbi:hypothetical protein ACJMK2_032106 [Sinanodonta woodiana]|uniref:Arachidonate 5-lipoxygenase n=1 Tax=Sinanodonta woodiana TaxID=1069815 RepID=A0ABD3X0R3_SINWO